jgi:hypothetical protein
MGLDRMRSAGSRLLWMPGIEAQGVLGDATRVQRAPQSSSRCESPGGMFCDCEPCLGRKVPVGP